VHPIPGGWLIVVSVPPPPPLDAPLPALRRTPRLVIRHDDSGVIVDTATIASGDDLLFIRPPNAPADRLVMCDELRRQRPPADGGGVDGAPVRRTAPATSAG